MMYIDSIDTGDEKEDKPNIEMITLDELETMIK